MTRSREESYLLAACLDLLRLKGIPAIRINSGTIRIDGRVVRLAPAGTSDILGILPPQGRFLAIETKSARGRLSPEQEAFLEGVRRAGGVSLVVRDLKSLQYALEDLLFSPEETFPFMDLT